MVLERDPYAIHQRRQKRRGGKERGGGKFWTTTNTGYMAPIGRKRVCAHCTMQCTHAVRTHDARRLDGTRSLFRRFPGTDVGGAACQWQTRYRPFSTVLLLLFLPFLAGVCLKYECVELESQRLCA